MIRSNLKSISIVESLSTVQKSFFSYMMHFQRKLRQNSINYRLNKEKLQRIKDSWKMLMRRNWKKRGKIFLSHFSNKLNDVLFAKKIGFFMVSKLTINFCAFFPKKNGRTKRGDEASLICLMWVPSYVCEYVCCADTTINFIFRFSLFPFPFHLEQVFIVRPNDAEEWPFKRYWFPFFLYAETKSEIQLIGSI